MKSVISSLLILLLLISGCSNAGVPSSDDSFNVNLTDAQDDARVTIRGQTNSGEPRVLEIDSNTNALVFISLPHNKTHEKESFVSDFVNEALVNDETIILAFKTMPGTTRIHMIVQSSTLVGGDTQIWEGATWDNQTGSDNAIYNRFREETINESGLLENTNQVAYLASGNLILNPANLNTASAVSLHHLYAWGRKDKISAGGVRDTEEWILKPDTRYAIVFTADGGENKAQLILNWYENTDR